jgi:hypothetical protein
MLGFNGGRTRTASSLQVIPEQIGGLFRKILLYREQKTIGPLVMDAARRKRVYSLYAATHLLFFLQGENQIPVLFWVRDRHADGRRAHTHRPLPTRLLPNAAAAAQPIIETRRTVEPHVRASGGPCGLLASSIPPGKKDPRRRAPPRAHDVALHRELRSRRPTTTGFARCGGGGGGGGIPPRKKRRNRARAPL